MSAMRAWMSFHSHSRLHRRHSLVRPPTPSFLQSATYSKIPSSESTVLVILGLPSPILLPKCIDPVVIHPVRSSPRRLSLSFCISLTIAPNHFADCEWNRPWSWKLSNGLLCSSNCLGFTHRNKYGQSEQTFASGPVSMNAAGRV